MKILVIEGSCAKASHTRLLAKAFAGALEARDLSVDIWSLLERPLPFPEAEYHWDFNNTPSEVVRAFGRKVMEADGLALASPLYHGSFSGMLKSALDHLWFDAFKDKPVALLSHGATDKRCAQPCEALMTVVKTMFGHALQTQVATSKGEFSHDADGHPTALTNEMIKVRLERQAEEMVRFMAMNLAYDRVMRERR